SRRKNGWGRTVTKTYRSPGGPPRSPASPSPASRMRCPSSIPAGTFTRIRRVRRTTPAPRHSRQAVSTVWPSPRQRGQVWTLTSRPRGVCCTRRTSPVPPHSGQVRMGVPGSALFPWQWGQTSTRGTEISVSMPKAASSKSSSRSYRRSAPRTGPPGPAPPAAAEEGVEDVFEAQIGEAAEGIEAAPAGAGAPAAGGTLEGGVAEPVVRRPLLRVGEDLVGLGRLLELLRRVGRFVHVRVVLACQPAVRLLDLVGRRRPV